MGEETIAEVKPGEETLIDKAYETSGTKNRYQIIMLIFTSLIWMNCDLLSISFPYLEIEPMVTYFDNTTGLNVTLELDYDTCTDYPNFTRTKVYGHSWVSEFDIECNKFKNSLIGFLVFAGGVLGSLTFPYISDRIGRKWSILLSISAYAALLLVSSFLNDFIAILIVSSLAMYCTQVSNNVAFLLLGEITSEKWRSTFGAVVNIGYNAGGFIFIILYKYTNSWRFVFIYTVVTCIPLVIAFTAYSKESPKFFILKKDFIKFIKCIRDVARRNKRVEAFDTFYLTEEKGLKSGFINLTEDTENSLSNSNANTSTDPNPNLTVSKTYEKTSTSDDELEHKSEIIFENVKNKTYTPFDLIRYKSQRKTFLIMCSLWFFISANFYGITFNLKNFKEDIYVSGFLTYSVDTFAYFISGFVADIFGRKNTILVSLLICIACFTTTIFIDNTTWPSFVCAFAARFSISNIFNILYFYSLEVYPTVVRSYGFGINNAFSHIGSLVIPIIVEYFESQINIIFAGINLLNLIMMIFMPETAGKPLQDFIPELLVEEVKNQVSDSRKAKEAAKQENGE